MAKILLVDDEADVCDFMFKFFEERNFEVLSAISGDEALLIIKRDHPDITLLDIRMKGRNGIEILREIKNIDNGAKVIMVTCVNDAKEMTRAKDLGAVAYVTKPLVLNDLMEVVLRNMGRRYNFFNFRRKYW